MDHPPAPGQPLTAALKAYQARLRAAGRLIEARAVGQCIKLAKAAGLA